MGRLRKALAVARARAALGEPRLRPEDPRLAGGRRRAAEHGRGGEEPAADDGVGGA